MTSLLKTVLKNTKHMKLIYVLNFKIQIFQFLVSHYYALIQLIKKMNTNYKDALTTNEWIQNSRTNTAEIGPSSFLLYSVYAVHLSCCLKYNLTNEFAG